MFRLAEWAKAYGDIYSLKLGSEDVIVLSSAGAMKEVIDKRSATTSDRPTSYLIDQVTNGLNFVFTRYSGYKRFMINADDLFVNCR